MLEGLNREKIIKVQKVPISLAIISVRKNRNFAYIMSIQETRWAGHGQGRLSSTVHCTELRATPFGHLVCCVLPV
jgi:hypothetical protein